MPNENSPLSEREKDIARILLQGKSNKQIALDLGISIRTVEFHLRNIYTKLGTASRTEAVLKLADAHLVETTGEVAGWEQGKTTVVDAADSTENEFQPILRRNAVKTSIYILVVLLSVTGIASLVISNLPRAGEKITPARSEGQSLADPTDNPIATPLPVSTETSQPAGIVIPPHTVNGYTAAIESYYIDAANIIFQVRISGEGIHFGDPDFYGRVRAIDLYDENGNPINSSGGTGPAIDPELIQLEFHPLTHLVGDHLKGQFAFDLNKTSAGDEPLAQFRFDFDLPIHEPQIYHPQQTVSANGLDILLDQVTVTPDFTLAYLCFQPPSFADWQIGRQSVLIIEGRETTPFNFTVPFDSALGGDRRAGYEPYWAPSVKTGRCIRSSFPTGSSNPTSLTLTIPKLERTDPDLLLTDQLNRDYPGLSPKDAYYKYLEEHGNTYKGPWIFELNLAP
jgi:DNA-binding CsgD family transcriptional regulator